VPEHYVKFLSPREYERSRWAVLSRDFFNLTIWREFQRAVFIDKKRVLLVQILQRGLLPIG
jgi:hypothetical protein